MLKRHITTTKPHNAPQQLLRPTQPQRRIPTKHLTRAILERINTIRELHLNRLVTDMVRSNYTASAGADYYEIASARLTTEYYHPHIVRLYIDKQLTASYDITKLKPQRIGNN